MEQKTKQGCLATATLTRTIKLQQQHPNIGDGEGSKGRLDGLDEFAQAKHHYET
jgi:hypothetical protein